MQYYSITVVYQILHSCRNVIYIFMDYKDIEPNHKNLQENDQQQIHRGGELWGGRSSRSVGGRIYTVP